MLRRIVLAAERALLGSVMSVIAMIAERRLARLRR
jgi:hypothetical protein